MLIACCIRLQSTSVLDPPVLGRLLVFQQHYKLTSQIGVREELLLLLRWCAAELMVITSRKIYGQHSEQWLHEIYSVSFVYFLNTVPDMI